MRPRFWIRWAFVVLLVAVFIYATFQIAHDSHEPVRVFWAGWSKENPGRRLLCITNGSNRPIDVVRRREVLIGGVWAESFGGITGRIVINPSTSSVPALSFFTPRMYTPDDRIEPGEHAVWQFSSPSQVGERSAFTAWRMRVEWSYATSSKLELWQDWIRRYFTGTGKVGAVRTNYSAAIQR